MTKKADRGAGQIGGKTPQTARRSGPLTRMTRNQALTGGQNDAFIIAVAVCLDRIQPGAEDDSAPG